MADDLDLRDVLFTKEQIARFDASAPSPYARAFLGRAKPPASASSKLLRRSSVGFGSPSHLFGPADKRRGYHADPALPVTPEALRLEELLSQREARIKARAMAKDSAASDVAVRSGGGGSVGERDRARIARWRRRRLRVEPQADAPTTAESVIKKLKYRLRAESERVEKGLRLLKLSLQSLDAVVGVDLEEKEEKVAGAFFSKAATLKPFPPRGSRGPAGLPGMFSPIAPRLGSRLFRTNSVALRDEEARIAREKAEKSAFDHVAGGDVVAVQDEEEYCSSGEDNETDDGDDQSESGPLELETANLSAAEGHSPITPTAPLRSQSWSDSIKRIMVKSESMPTMEATPSSSSSSSSSPSPSSSSSSESISRSPPPPPPTPPPPLLSPDDIDANRGNRIMDKMNKKMTPREARRMTKGPSRRLTKKISFDALEASRGSMKELLKERWRRERVGG